MCLPEQFLLKIVRRVSMRIADLNADAIRSRGLPMDAYAHRSVCDKMSLRT